MFHRQPCPDCDHSQHPGQCESLRTGGTGIEEQRVTSPLMVWLVRVTKDADVWLHAVQENLSFSCKFSTYVQNMANGNSDSRQFDERLRRKAALLVPIDVTGNRRHRSDSLEVIDNGGLADITGMHDMIDVLEMLQNCRVEQAMRIGDDSDTDGT